MRRDPRLHGLSSDHHQGLLLARRHGRACVEGWPAAEAAALLREAFAADLAPHFAAEEEVLLPALAAAGEGALAERALAEHAAMRDLLGRAGGPDGVEPLRAFATALEAHIRFEERELFPAAERSLPIEALDRIGARTPHPRDRPDARCTVFPARRSGA
jgi:iron-sulfur cluster repair protein YtfE (RIC family)